MIAPTTNLPLAGKLVLVLEDNFLIGLDITAVLETAGATVLGPAGNIETAFALLKRDAKNPDLAVLDVNLAGGRSYSVANDLIDRGVPFLFLTGYDANHIPVGYRGHPRLGKPLDNRALLRALVALASIGPILDYSI